MPAIGTMLKLTLVGCFAAALVLALNTIVAALGTDPARPELVDFHLFHLVGTLAAQGRLADAYHLASLAPIERDLAGGREILLPWSYPPVFALLLAPLSRLPVGLAALVFIGASFALFVAVLSRLAGEGRWIALLAVAPAVIVNILDGQTGLMMAGLVGLAGLWRVQYPARAGAALAGLALKPHFALALPLQLLLEGRWRVLAAAAATAVALGLATLAAFGPGVFTAFLAALPETESFLRLGRYQMHRVTSVYAAAATFGLPYGPALALHTAVGLAVLVWTLRLARASEDPRTALGLVLLACPFVTPYSLDYDTVLFGLGLAPLLPDLAARLGTRRLGCLLGVTAASELVGIVLGDFGLHLSLGGPLLLAVALTVFATMERGVRTRPAVLPLVPA